MPTLESVHQGPAAAQRPGPGVPGGGRALLVAAGTPLLGGYLGIAAVLALVTAAAGAPPDLAGVLRAAGPGWLAAYHVPVTVHGRELGMLPLLPTILMLSLVARSASTAVGRLGWATPRSARRVIGVVGAAHAAFAALIALATAHTAVTTSPVVAFFVAGILAAAAATVGTARRCGLLTAVLRRADDTTATGLRAGLLAVAGFAGAGAVVFVAALLASWSGAVAVFRVEASGAGGGLGMFLLCLAYLPNVLIGTLSLAAGPGFTIGRLAVAQWHFHPGAVPPVPVLAPVPAGAAHWWPALLVLPVTVGVLVGLRCRTAPARLRAVGVAALVAGLAWLVLAGLAGGALAGGPFDPVTVPAGLLGASVFALVAGPGAAAVWLTGRAPDEEPAVEEPAEAAGEPEPETGTE
jgi:hypothetical protein